MLIHSAVLKMTTPSQNMKKMFLVCFFLLSETENENKKNNFMFLILKTKKAFVFQDKNLITNLFLFAF